MTPSELRRQRRSSRSTWWFERMREVVDKAIEEKPMKDYGKKTIGDSGTHDPEKETPEGFSWWIENGVYYMAPTVDPAKFGPHTYAIRDYTGICSACGCYMGEYRSSGPVDPFGACPENPNPFPA